MAEVPHAAPIEDSFPGVGSYRQELNRTLGGAQVFAISFAFMSVAVGVFGTYDDVLQTAGPIGIWLWVIAAVGQTLVALVIAQFAARISLAGSSYQWASRLANPRVGWGFGWLSFCYLAIAVVAVDNALASMAFMPLVGLEPNEEVARIITVVVLLIQAVLAIASTRIVGMLNVCAVGVEVAIIGVLVVALTIAVLITGLGSTANLTARGITANAPGYFAVGGGLTIAMIMGLATLVGFDAAAAPSRTMTSALSISTSSTCPSCRPPMVSGANAISMSPSTAARAQSISLSRTTKPKPVPSLSCAKRPLPCPFA